MHIVIVSEDLGILYQNVDDRTVFQVLTKTSDCDAVSAMAGNLFQISKDPEMVGEVRYILDEDIVGSWLDGYAIIAALVDHVRQHDVVGVHGVEAVCVLHPVCAKWSIDCCCVAEDIVEPHILSVHNIQRPKRRVLHINYMCELAVLVMEQLDTYSARRTHRSRSKRQKASASPAVYLLLRHYTTHSRSHKFHQCRSH